MAVFDLAKAKQEQSLVLKSGTYAARIIHVVDVGLVPAFDPQDPPKESHGFTFQLADGRVITKVMPNSIHPASNMAQLLSVFEDDVQSLADLAGRKLGLEVEENGQWPRIKGYYEYACGLFDEVASFPEAELIVLVSEGEEGINIKSNAEKIKSLPSEIRKALMAKPKGAI